jgi:hypothetical protein
MLQAIKIIRSGIAEGMDWNYLAKLVKEEKKKGDPIASIIHKLKLDSNEVTTNILHTPLTACLTDIPAAHQQSRRPN